MQLCKLFLLLQIFGLKVRATGTFSLGTASVADREFLCELVYVLYMGKDIVGVTKGATLLRDL